MHCLIIGTIGKLLRLVAIYSVIFYCVGYTEMLHFVVTPTSPWKATNMYMGPSLFVKDSTTDILVTYSNSTLGAYLLALYFMDPLIKDSCRFLFHNLHSKFPQETTTVNIGHFPRGTPIVFCSILEDTIPRMSAYRGKKLYSGQCRIGVDQYISEKGSTNWGKKWAVAGRVIDSTKIEMGFSDGSSLTFRSVMFSVTNVYIEGLEKNKVPTPIINPNNDTIADTVHCTLSVPQEGLYNAIQFADTVWPASGSQLKIYYTLDGNNPTTQSQQYVSPILLSQSAIIKAFAVIQGDTNWFPSEISTKTFFKRPQLATPVAAPTAQHFPDSLNVSISVPDVSDAKIYYSVNNSSPDSLSGILYSQSITLKSTTTVKAIAYKQGYLPSVVMSAEYIKDATGIYSLSSLAGLKRIPITVYSIAGKKIGTFNGRLGTAGPALDQAQIALPSGIYYFYAQNENVDKKAGRRVVWNRR